MTNFIHVQWVHLILNVSLVKFGSTENDQPMVIDLDDWYSQPYNVTAEVIEIQILNLKNIGPIYCNKLKNLRVFNANRQGSITSIEANAFNNCTKLTRVDFFHSSIQTIHPKTFDYNPNLEFVSFYGAKLEEIPPQLFRNNLKLQVLFYNKTN